MTGSKPTRSIREVEPGIYMIPGSRAGGCNTYLMRGSRRNALIDTGLPVDHDYLCQCLADIGLGMQDIHYALVTHEHLDHAGGLSRLPEHIVVAAHVRTANKFVLDDKFSMMSAVFKSTVTKFHVDFHLEDGALIDLGDLQVRTIYTPGHCSGAVCFFEPRRGALFTADTVFAGGILGGIFASGNTSDYINSLERLKELRLVRLYPGHGRPSSAPYTDLDRAIAGSRALMRDTQILFEAIDHGSAFTSITKAAIDYSWRAAERRKTARVKGGLTAVVQVEDAQHPAFTLDLSTSGLLLDGEIPAGIAGKLQVTLEGLGVFDCLVVAQHAGHTRMKIVSAIGEDSELATWVSRRAAGKAMV
ncbi:MAG: MBL fold metallo-hydrolase [Rhodoferax sp.]|nr:MBL fold metallo-hydrolase [Rhodoferax sp.]